MYIKDNVFTIRVKASNDTVYKIDMERAETEEQLFCITIIDEVGKFFRHDKSSFLVDAECNIVSVYDCDLDSDVVLVILDHIKTNEFLKELIKE